MNEVVLRDLSKMPLKIFLKLVVIFYTVGTLDPLVAMLNPHRNQIDSLLIKQCEVMSLHAKSYYMSMKYLR